MLQLNEYSWTKHLNYYAYKKVYNLFLLNFIFCATKHYKLCFYFGYKIKLPYDVKMSYLYQKGMHCFLFFIFHYCTQLLIHTRYRRRCWYYISCGMIANLCFNWFHTSRITSASVLVTRIVMIVNIISLTLTQLLIMVY